MSEDTGVRRARLPDAVAQARLDGNASSGAWALRMNRSMT
jgi:hypothetical protein